MECVLVFRIHRKMFAANANAVYPSVRRAAIKRLLLVVRRRFTIIMSLLHPVTVVIVIVKYSFADIWEVGNYNALCGRQYIIRMDVRHLTPPPYPPQLKTQRIYIDPRNRFSQK